MLKDDAIRQGRILPTKDDVERMNLSKKEVDDIKVEFKKNMLAEDEPSTSSPATPDAPDKKTKKAKKTS